MLTSKIIENLIRNSYDLATIVHSLRQVYFANNIDRINMDSTIEGSVNDNINMDSTIEWSVNARTLLTR
jgi:hypothetical protein